MTKRKLPLATIIWEDAAQYTGYNSLDHEFSPMEIVTCGYLLEKSQRQIVIATQLSPGDMQAKDVHVIPRKYVKKILMTDQTFEIED